ncbi:MAG: apolipoprotein N-acyltransferase [Candidatus Omnitrophica bacterium]|nr:apolipoprotein N-acyltransferase [Candidatus Omnitrophota bacterium]MDD5488440.1 apolipoprotein N-acyltransferase [Candidatus Omnitrophota bacterium]
MLNIKWRTLSTANRYMLAALSGIVGGMAFPPAELSFTAWLFLVPLLFSVKGVNARTAFLLGWTSGLTFYGTVLYWMVNVTVPGTVILVMTLAVFNAGFALVVYMAFKRGIDLMILAPVWVLLDYIRAHLFTGFPWGMPGYSQSKNINLIQIADFAGVYGVSFIIVAFNVALYSYITRGQKKTIHMFMALFFIVGATVYSVSRIDGIFTADGPKVSVVQGNIPQSFKWDPVRASEIIEKYDILTLEAAKDRPDMIIWPETAFPYLVEGKDEASYGRLSEISERSGIPLLAGMVTERDGEYYNSAGFFSRVGKLGDIYSKAHLVPFGEYIPFEKAMGFLRGVIDKPIGTYARGGKKTIFTLATIRTDRTEEGALLRDTSFYRLGVMICFEDVFPYIARDLAAGGADLLVNMTNDAWFGPTAAPMQHMQSSVFRAIENRKPVVRAANTGISCFIDVYGRVTSIFSRNGNYTDEEGVLTSDVYVYKGRTYYTLYGDVFVLLCAILFIMSMVAEEMMSRRADKNGEGKA